MGLTLAKVPGFTDVSDAPLTHDKVAMGIHVAEINDNAAFGMVRCEVFQGTYKNGDSVVTPVSPVDGYAYSRSELLYVWGIFTTANPQTNWITGPDSLWFGAWKVDQVTGEVSCLEGYRRSGSNDQATQSQDGVLWVWTIAQRGAPNLAIATPPTYSDLGSGSFMQDAPYAETLARTLSHNSKFGTVKGEVIYMGEFYTGQQVPQPVSPVDGHTYAYADCKFHLSWRWTVQGTGFVTPPKSLVQMGPIKAAVDGTGHVALSVAWIDNGENLSTHTEYGRVAVFAFCGRDAALGFSTPATSFAEVTQDHFYPGMDLQASVLAQVNQNCREAAVALEFFGPTTYYYNQVIPCPTSPVDGYTYVRAELFYVLEFNDTTPASGSNLRTIAFSAIIDPSNGKLSHLDIWRLPPGGPPVLCHGNGSSYGSVRVTVIGVRTAVNSTASTHVDLPALALSTSGGGEAPTANRHWLSGMKIIGSAFFTPTAQNVALTCTLEASDYPSGANTGTNVYKADLMVVDAGSSVVLYRIPITFGGSRTATIAGSSTLQSDQVGFVADSAHDYVIVVAFDGAEATCAAPDASKPVWNKVENGTMTYLSTLAHPNSIDELADFNDVSFFASGVKMTFQDATNDPYYRLISAISYDTNPLAPPVDVSSQTADGGDDTVNGT